MAWTGWNGDRITREKRDAFIKANGGYIKPAPKKYKILKREE
jgi:hypothetical protein